MKKFLNIFTFALKSSVLLLIITVDINAQIQSGLKPDPNFDAKVERPAYTKKHPKVLLDEAHENFFQIGNRMKPFVDLLTNDGYQVTNNKETFSDDLLRKYDVLAIVIAAGKGTTIREKAESAFSEEEIDAVYNWVQKGGSLLLAFDHYPFDVSIEPLANRFGVTISKGQVIDPINYDKSEYNVYNVVGTPDLANRFLVFTKENGLLKDHPITRGRNSSERINKVMLFGGSSLSSSQGVEFLTLSRTARNSARNGMMSPNIERAKGAAMKIGKGRVVIIGDSNILLAEMDRGTESKGKPSPLGMSRTDYDGKQFVLNMMHWLSGLLK